MANRFLNRISATVARIFFPRRGKSASLRLGLGLLGVLVLGASLVLGYWDKTALSSDGGSLDRTTLDNSTLVFPAGEEQGLPEQRPEQAAGDRAGNAVVTAQSGAAPQPPKADPSSASSASSTTPVTPGAAPTASATPGSSSNRSGETATAAVGPSATPTGTQLAQAPAPTTGNAQAPSPTSAAPAELPSDLDLYPPDMRRLMTQGYLIVGIPNFDTPPLYFEQNGELQGADIDIARSLGEKLDLDVRFDRQSTSLDNLIDRTARHEVDLAIGKLSTTMPRLKKVHASPNYIRFKQALLIDRTQLLEMGGKDAESIQSLLKTQAISIGVIKNTSYERFAKQNFPNAEVIGFPSWTEATQALAAGQVFAIYRDENEIKKIIMSQPQLAIRLKSVLFNDLEDPKAIFVSLANPQLAHVIDNVIQNDPSHMWTSDRLIDTFYDIYTDPSFASN